MQSVRQILERIAVQPGQARDDLLVRLVAAVRPSRHWNQAQARDRLPQLIEALRARPHLAAGLRRYLAGLLSVQVHRTLYAEAGILDNEGFASALMRRCTQRLLPAPHEARFLKDLFARVFNDPNDTHWLACVPRQTWHELIAALALHEPDFAPGSRRIRGELFEALRILAARLAVIGLEPEVLRYFSDLADYESPFVALGAELGDFASRCLGGQAQDITAEANHSRVLLQQCTIYLQRIRRRSREAGTSVQLTYLLARAEQIIQRIEVLLDLLCGAPAEDRTLAFFLLLLSEERRKHSVRDLLRTTTDLLAREVTEHASRTGEHYVSETRREYLQMLRAACGAGLIVGVMALVKIGIARAHLPPLWEAIGYSLNYGLGFVIVHLLHFTIATKQPAMTAATLASAIDGAHDEEQRLDALTELVVKVCRTQFVAILGNVVFGFASALGIGYLLTQVLRLAPVDAVKGAHLLHEIHPWASLALPHAAIAGVCLFLAGVISGYYDNKAIYNQVPARLRALSWLNRWLGPRRTRRMANYIETNLGALAGNFLFGCMLGSMGTLGFILGLPLDIRHVTFAAANYAYGLVATDFAITPGQALVLSLGVVGIGLVNLAVSFGLALRLSLRARRVSIPDFARLRRRLWQRFKAAPRDFIWPPREARAVNPPGIEHG